MRNTQFIRIVVIAVLTAIVLTFAAGCKKEEIEIGIDGSQGYTDGASPDSNDSPTEYVYTAQSIPLPSDMTDVYGLTYVNDKLCFAATVYDYGSNEHVQMYTFSSNIYTINTDGTELTALEGYKPPIETPSGLYGGSSIKAMAVDNEGNIWVAEQWVFHSYDLPHNFNMGYDALTEYYVENGYGIAIRKLDSTGAELLSINTSDLIELRPEHYESNYWESLHEYFYDSMFTVDESGNVYVTVKPINSSETYVFDSSGNLQFQLNAAVEVTNIIRMSDGQMALSGFMKYDNGQVSSARIFQTIDLDAKDLGEPMMISSEYGFMYTGFGDYPILINDYSDLYGYLIEENETVSLLNWFDLGIRSSSMANIITLPEERFACTNLTTDSSTGNMRCEIIIFAKTPRLVNDERIELTLATLGLIRSAQRAVMDFNRTNPDYYIRIVNYAEFNVGDDDTNGYTRLVTDTITGNMPDILDVARLQYKQFVGRGFLADLYPFIDADPEYIRSDFVQGAFKAAEINGSLYTVFTDFYVNTISGPPSVLGESAGWNIDEFADVLKANSQADAPLGTLMTRMDFLQYTVMSNIDNYIDWDTGTAHFDTAEFIRLLELTQEYVTDFDLMKELNNPNSIAFVEEAEAFGRGRQLMRRSTVMGFDNFVGDREIFGGEVVYKGYPNDDRNGHSITFDTGFAILEQSPNKEGAWEFVRTILDKDWQLVLVGGNTHPHGFPTNQAAFDQMMQASLEKTHTQGWGGRRLDDMAQADVDKVAALVNSASSIAYDYYTWGSDRSIINIISESAADYFSGLISAERAAEIIQSRVSILVSERG